MSLPRTRRATLFIVALSLSNPPWVFEVLALLPVVAWETDQTISAFCDELPFNPNSFAVIAGLHGNPTPSYCIHGNNGFLSWHRAYLLEIENALRTIHCEITLPYWNWSTSDTTGVPEACKDPTYINRDGDTVANPLYSGPKPASLGGGETSRRSDIDTTSFGDLASTAQTAIANTVWDVLKPLLNN